MMVDFMDIVRGRRSVREYQAQEVSDDTVRGILDAVRWSPSWSNSQCWEVVVVRDLGNRQRLQETLSPTNPARQAMIQAPVVLAVCGRLKRAGFSGAKASTSLGDWFMFDLGIATQSLCLAAWHVGLGTVIVGSFDHERAGRTLRLPENHEVAVLVPLGFPGHEPEAPSRRETKEFTHREGF